LENFSRLCWSIATPSLDHRCDASAERLRRLHVEPDELEKQQTEIMEDIRWFAMVAPEHALQRTKRRLQRELLSGFVEDAPQ